MRILYISCHAILEYDEVSLLGRLGHEVFPVGLYFGGRPAEAYRPPLAWSAAQEALLKAFHASGCAYENREVRLTADFVRLFDLTIVMHELEVFERNWQALRVRPVAWRTIGQGADYMERRMAPYRDRGTYILRYSPAEASYRRYLGGDALLRFHKDPEEYRDWQGDEDIVLTFANDFRQRYPQTFAAYERATKGLPAKLGGSGNDACANAIGLVPFEKQKSLLRSARVYFYASGLAIPYTLNFMEAWMTGIPVVALAPAAGGESGAHAEIPRLIEHGRTGLIAATPAEARDFLATLLADRALAARIGAAGREAAAGIFGIAPVSAAWQATLAGLRNRPGGLANTLIRRAWRAIGPRPQPLR